MSSLSIYTGFWHDYSRGEVLEWTLTLSVRWSGYLLAALTTFIGFVGACFWDVLAFAIHQWRAKADEADGVYFQQQVIYRNPSSPLGTLSQLFKVGWAWRAQKNGLNSATRSKRRSFYLSLPPLLVFVAFTAAGIFVGEITSPTYKGNNVKVRPIRCGMVVYNITTTTGFRAARLKTVDDTLAARAYATNCYGKPSSLVTCSLYPKISLPYDVTSVDCPFGNDPAGQQLCIPSQALSADTGLLDSNDYLGINTAKKNRVLFRKSATCSPIRIQGYSEISKEITSGFAVYEYYMGPVGKVSNWTFLYDSHTQADNVGYQIL